MKKVMAIAVLGLFGLTACKKDYTCTCTFSDDDTLTLPFSNAKKKDAEQGCKDAETTYKNADASTSCTLN